MPQDVTIFITDRNGVKHEVLAPTDMNMNIMELIRSYELAEEGTVGEGHLSVRHAFAFAPCDVLADASAFLLREA